MGIIKSFLDRLFKKRDVKFMFWIRRFKKINPYLLVGELEIPSRI